MISMKDYLTQAERYSDFRREAQREEYARQMLGRRKTELTYVQHAVQRTAAWVGSQLVAWGSALEHYANPAGIEPTLSLTKH